MKITRTKIQVAFSLTIFLAQSFFKACPRHTNHQKNKKTKCCPRYNVALCKYCEATGAHNGHPLLKIYRHVYEDAVVLDEVQGHIDCSRRQIVVAVHPLPHYKSGEKQLHNACEFCMRKLMDPGHYSYCSIACKYPNEDPANQPSIPPSAANEAVEKCCKWCIMSP